MAVRTGMEKEDGSRLHATKAAKASVNFLSQNLFASDDARILTGMVSDTKKKNLPFCYLNTFASEVLETKHPTIHTSTFLTAITIQSEKVRRRTKKWKSFYNFL